VNGLQAKAGGISSGFFYRQLSRKPRGAGGLFANRSRAFREGNAVN
jgi:hypothetical protein